MFEPRGEAFQVDVVDVPLGISLYQLRYPVSDSWELISSEYIDLSAVTSHLFSEIESFGHPFQYPERCILQPGYIHVDNDLRLPGPHSLPVHHPVEHVMSCRDTCQHC